jgi:hypothetical protein
MATCEVCGNDGSHAFTVTLADEQHVFDCFECAIQALAPVCGHCGSRVIGHGVEQNGTVFCSRECAAHVPGRSPIDQGRPQRSGIRHAANARGAFIIQRASESRCEWWTGSRWSADIAKAQRYADEPNASAETGDESADAAAIERVV